MFNEIFSTKQFKVYGINDNVEYKFTNENPDRRPLLPYWMKHTLLSDNGTRNQKEIIIIQIAHLPNIRYLRDIEEIIIACYKQKITVVIESTWEAAEDRFYDPNIISLNESLNFIRDLINPEYFKILVSNDLNYIYVNEEYKKLFVYVNVFAIMMGLYKNNVKQSKIKKYNFSCLGGRVLRDRRMYFLSEIYYRNIKDDKFLITAIPPLQQWERKKEGAKNPELMLKSLTDDPENLHKTFKDHALDIFPDLKLPCWDKMREYFIENFDKIILNHKFVDEDTQSTTINDLKSSLSKSKFLKDSIWGSSFTIYDHIIPTGLLESYINIPLETYPHHSFFTEKTIKPILAGIPFISVSTPNFTEVFKLMGLEPYYGIFDYSYENETDIYKRTSLIVDQLESLQKDNLKELINDNTDTIEHNQNKMEKISNDYSFLERI
tara:strand:- start:1155 stop:2459 length:1305 start_codon:yes stop_codon:yes gene_type:complete